MSTIAATADPTNGAMSLTITPDASGSAYVFRRDSRGVGVVRAAQTGLTLTAGTPITIPDYEARQGDSTDYLLTNSDGTVQAVDTEPVPAWGTWLKSPGRPWLNTLTAFGDDEDAVLAMPRSVVNIDGASLPVVLTGERQAAAGAVTLAVRTSAELAGIMALLQDGGTLLLDTNPAWGVPYTYVEVGDVKVQRAFHELGLDKPWRLVQLDGLVSVAPPLDPFESNPTATYDALPVKFATYAALAATTTSYNALAVA